VATATEPPPAAATAPSREAPAAPSRPDADRRRLNWILGSPLIVVLVLLLAFPLLFNLYLSLTGWQPNLGDWWDANWTGLNNYGDVFSDGRLWAAVARTTVILIVCLAIEGGLGLLLALCFMRPFRGRTLLMGLFLVPMMILPVVNGFIFFMLFQSDGPVNGLVGAVLGTDFAYQWLGNSFGALVAVVATDVYQWTPLMFLILLAGVLSVPPNLRNAARVLGATPWQEFRYVILPLIRPVIVVALIIRGIEVFKLFDAVYILTGGGPGTSTESLSVYLYKLSFQDFRLGYAAAVAFVVLIMLSVVGMHAIRFLHAREERTA
jgi:multiple sugar transport system permease protein